MGATAQALSGGRLHLSHGPIDLILKAVGPGEAVATANRAALARFPAILPELTEELAILRQPVRPNGAAPRSPVGRRMWAAALPHYPVFVTSMAAVAGAVADELMDVMLAAAPDLETVFVNDGGDIALFCGPGQSLLIGIAGLQDEAGRPSHLEPGSNASAPSSPARPTATLGPGRHGVATSGARGRSFSLGIADAVTVIAATAAAADVAATLIANDVTADHPGIVRKPARDLDPDSDLGDRAVTVRVPELPPDVIRQALESGGRTARRFVEAGLIRAVLLALQGQTLEVAADGAPRLMGRA